MSFTVIKVILALFFLECLVHCNKYKNSDKNVNPIQFLKKENGWIKDVKNIIKMKKEAYQLMNLRYNEISQTHMLGGPKTPLDVSKSFPVVIRLTKLWPMICLFVKENFGIPCKIKEFPVDVPTVWEIGVTSLLRVQLTQNISAETLAISMEGPYHTTTRMAPICYDVGTELFRMRYAHLATDWFLVALKRAQGTEGKDLRLQVLEYLHLAQCFRGDSKAAVKSLLALLEEFPKFNPSLLLRDEYNMTANTSCPELAKLIKPSKELINTMVDVQNQSCQHQSKDPSILRYLGCYILKSLLPHCYIQPLRLEQLGTDPFSVLFYGTISKKEQEAIKKIFKDANVLFLQDCIVYNDER